MLKRTVFVCLAAFVISACGGGGGGGSAPAAPSTLSTPITPSTPSTPTIPANLFADSSDYQAACEVPRQGINPATGFLYPDIQGSTLQENQWLRSWSNELYLWYDEIVYEDPALFADPIDYFYTLKTLAVTPSGAERDNYHFHYNTEEWEQLSQSGVSSGYGMHYAVDEVSSPSPRIVVSYVEPNSPAELAGLIRGTEIKGVDGSGSVEIIQSGMYPQNPDEPHTFLVILPGASSTSLVPITSANVVSSPVLKTAVYGDLPEVGYIVFNQHIATAEEQLVDSFAFLSDAFVTDLVLDLRYNTGGYLYMASQVAYMIAGPAKTSGRIFEEQSFNDKHPTRDPFTQEIITPVPFISETLGFDSLTPGQPLPTLDLSRVFILTSADTCSASEAIINGLRGINVEVILIGDTTCGKPYGFYPQDNCGTTYFTIQFSGENDIGFSDYSDGFSPQNIPSNAGVQVAGCAVADDFSHPLGHPQEQLLSAALSYRDTSTCGSHLIFPSSNSLLSSNTSVNSFSNSFSQSFEDIPKQSLQQSAFSINNKILGLPK